MIRDANVNYDVDHHNDSFILRVNSAPYINYRIIQIPVKTLLKTLGTISIRDVDNLNPITLYANPSEFIELHEVYEKCLVIWIRKEGLREIMVIDISVKSSPQRISFRIANDISSESYAVFPGTIDDMESRLYRSFNSHCLIFTNSSYSKQPATYWYSFESRKIFAQNEQKVHDKYLEKRLWINSSSSNLKIPISIILLKNISGQALPTIVNAYGSYGTFKDPIFNSDLFPLLNRGMVFALCHPR